MTDENRLVNARAEATFATLAELLAAHGVSVPPEPGAPPSPPRPR